jgi:RHS repeat-associated protein
MTNVAKSLILGSFLGCSSYAGPSVVCVAEDRVVAEFGSSSAVVFSYDAVGNLASERVVDFSGQTLGKKLYEYSDASQLLRVRDASGSVKSSFGYDAAGKLVKIDDTRIEYNEFNMMSLLKKPGTQASYYYDALTGIRSGKVVNGQEVRFVLDEMDRVVQEVAPNGELVSSITYGLNGPEKYMIGGNVYSYVLNQVGDVVALVDESGAVVNTYSYDSWGKLDAINESVANPIRFRGEYFDSETGFYYLRGRYYDPATRRFTTSDPAEDGLNWFSYCGNNPWEYVDPSGYVRIAMTPVEQNIPHCSDMLITQEVLYYSGRHLFELIDVPSTIFSLGQTLIGWVSCAGIALDIIGMMNSASNVSLGIIKTAGLAGRGLKVSRLMTVDIMMADRKRQIGSTKVEIVDAEEIDRLAGGLYVGQMAVEL